ncbi:3-methyladenine DNA glycosylase 2 [Iodobacter sp. CM08]|uniref:DNA-3-methyladenine glycosylase family protein n=1 Tax=Iodobacter sp. CM08 TaxID=3085902 RepID=UPI0029823A55|nr:3-methyladenine DNA glycosylase 2 [Iodobacter sp. CM08]MDW5418359.1 3-methyladenine DNA glycosylase 2 [Iodobacter sp. CM08]
MTQLLSCSIPLCTAFRAGDILAFHGRDPQAISEQITAHILQKGIVWRGAAACLSICFQPEHAEVQLQIDGAAEDGDSQAAFEAMAYRMLGLTQDIEAFEAQYRSHALLGALISQQAGLRVPLTATPFEALTWAITGQQISVGAAVAIRRRLILAADIRHSGGLFCSPEASQIASLSEQTLRQAGFSLSKAQTLAALAQMVAQKQLPLDAWVQKLPVAEARAALEAIRGIGPWTVNYTLLRGFGWLDGSLHGDVAVRKALQILLGQTEKISEKDAKIWLEEFTPFRALVGAHLWSSLAKLA